MYVPDMPTMTSRGADAAARLPVARRAVSMGVVASLLCSTLTTISAPAQPASAAPAPATAAALPAGGLVPSASGYGKTAGSFSVSNDGSAQYRVPLWTPDGHGQGKPDLSLSYDSRAGNGLIGVGWSLAGLSSIAPCAKTIAQDGHTDGVSFDASDAFCLGEARLLPVTPLPPPPAQLQEREYRTEQESFTRVIGYGMVNNLPTFFKAWTKDGKILTFGQSPDARRQAFRLAAGGQDNTLVPERTTRVTLAWDVNRIEDRNGNAATVEYERVEGTADQLWQVESRPKTIKYAPNREVQFSYEDRTDPIESYGRGVHTREPKRLVMVSMYRAQPGGTGELLREYRIGYQNTSITKRSLVTSITECDGPACKQPITFAWSLGSYAMQSIDTTIGDGGQYRPLGGEPPQGNDVDNQIVVGDFDGDSRDDILYPNTDDWLHDVDQVDDPQKQSVQQKWFLRLSTGSGFGPAKPAGFAPPVHHCISPPPGRRGIECTASKGRVHPIDVDLDGRLEVLVWVPVSATRSRWRLYTFNGTTFVPHSSKLEGREETDNFPDPAYFADLDGNGTPDFITAPEDHHAWDSFAEFSEIDGPWTYRLNTAEPGTARFASPVNTLQRVPSRPAAQVVDANADGRADLIGSDALGWGLHGSGAVEPRRYAGAVSTPETPRRSVADINGDGLEDAVSPYTIWRDDLPQAPKGRLVAALSSGNGVGPFSTSPNNYWEPEWRRVPAPPPGGEPGKIDWGYNRGVHYVDFNADGADDVLIFRGGTPSSTDPTRFGAQLYVWRDGGFEWAPLNREAGSRGPGGLTASRTLDIDGDGMLDILHVQDDLDAGAGEPKGRLRILKHAGGVPDRVIGIGSLTRDRIEVDYTTLADRDVHIPGTSCTYPQICLTHGGSVVAAHRTWTYASSGGAPGWDQYNHLYLAGKQDVLGRGWLGFGSHIVTRALTGAQTITQFDNTTRDEAIDAYPFANLPNRVTSTIKDSPTGREHQTVVVTQYGVRRHPGGGYSVEPRQVDATAQERPASGGAWQLLRQTATTTAFDDYGNAALTTIQTAGGRMVVQDPIYRNDTTAWLLGLPTRQQTRACTAANVACVTRTSTFDYDAKGNQILAVTEPNKPDMKLSTTSVYDQYGNLTAVTRTDAANHARTERFEYTDADKIYPTATINALGHKWVIETHSGLGVPLRTTDPNGVVTTMRYDRFGRPRATYHADGSFDEITHSRQGALDLTTTTTAGGGQTSVLTDQLDREIQNAMKAFDGRLATTYTRYDPLGRPRDVSRPNFADETLRFTTTGYDNRDRPVSVAAPDGVTVRHTYANRESHTYDGNNVHASYTVTNVDGEVVSSFQNDPKSTGWLSTRYEYGPFGEATRAVAPDDTQQVMTYDSLGRRTRLVDPSTGTTTTGYNAFGEIVTQTDGNGRTTTLGHDVAGRVTTSTSPDGAATNIWDTAPHGKGLLAKATSSDGVVTVSTYDEHSKPETATWTVDGANYQIGYAYDQYGRQAQLTYPAIPGANGRLKVNYAYNPAGYLHQVKDPAAGGTVYWTAEDRNSAGQLVWERLGDGATSTLDHRVFDAATGLLNGITVTGPGGLDEDTTYGYDNNRNVTARAGAGRTETHTLRHSQPAHVVEIDRGRDHLHDHLRLRQGRQPQNRDRQWHTRTKHHLHVRRRRPTARPDRPQRNPVRLRRRRPADHRRRPDDHL